MKFVFKKYLRNTAPEKERDQHEIQSNPSQSKARQPMLQHRFGSNKKLARQRVKHVNSRQWKLFPLCHIFGNK